MRRNIHKKGFTLIELLVVIAIIALLASIVLIALGSARSKSRDAKRRADLTQLSSALELYYSDNGSYPTTGGAWYGVSPTFGSKGTSGAGGWIPNLSPTYVATLPVDPKPGVNVQAGYTGGYIYQSNGTDYMVLDWQSVENCANIASDPMHRPSQPNECDYAVYTPGGSQY